MLDKPCQVMPKNWQDMAHQGFRWKENVNSYTERKVSVGEYLQALREKHGQDNVLVGVPANEHGIPDNTIKGSDDMVGIYIRDKADSQNDMSGTVSAAVLTDQQTKLLKVVAEGDGAWDARRIDITCSARYGDKASNGTILAQLQELEKLGLVKADNSSGVGGRWATTLGVEYTQKKHLSEV